VCTKKQHHHLAEAGNDLLQEHNYLKSLNQLVWHIACKVPAYLTKPVSVTEAGKILGKDANHS
jgi:hypothetical protein